MHSSDRTLLASLGFADADKRDPRHDWACQYLAQPDQVRQLVGAAALQAATRNGSEIVKMWALPEIEVAKGDGSYRRSIGFIDLAIGIETYRDHAAEQLRHRYLGIIVEVKIGLVPIGDAIRQITLYRSHHPDFPPWRGSPPRGSRQYVRQCTRCFKWGGTLPRSAVSAREIALALPLNAAAREVWEGQRRRLRERLLAAEHADDSAQFWARYTEYLNSPEWAARRARILERDGFTCQACLAAKATQAHHLTYEHVFNELLWELVAVCLGCHERLHAEAKAGGKGR
jgi:5-methylcytosine-specific restriction endonuclease McrA